MEVNGQRSKAGVTSVDVALTSLGLTWQAERKGAWGAWGCVAALVCAWERMRAWLESQKLLAAHGGVCGAESGRFWWQWTGLDEIYPMKVVLSQTETRR